MGGEEGEGKMGESHPTLSDQTRAEGTTTTVPQLLMPIRSGRSFGYCSGICMVVLFHTNNMELQTNGRDIISMHPDKYSIINLKLEAETALAYVNSTEITMDNAMDNLKSTLIRKILHFSKTIS